VPILNVTRRDGSERRIAAPAGQSLKDALKAAGVDEVLGLCGGYASCGTCHVHVAEDWLQRLPSMRADEDELLGYSDWRQPNSRLACQILLTEDLDGIALAVAPED
jgi:2Fe-2S ferredoxin